MTTTAKATGRTDDDTERAIAAMRDAVACIRSRDYAGALVQSELATLLLRIVAGRERR